ncbi:ribokinase [Pleurocapsa sp. CCALA 161]|uniref:sugar kinase n=1 Tax=Pleurocapsa sp. CCALA 161 TaxID=2107688 RepID=UPI000D083639|nr:sugar kinase [Pleurocapsa sp. CCALA 161]PSB11550.1 ribokinase [Pleurocapsa sp. CCALA 161]
MTYRGLFVGLTTLDFIYLSDRPVQANQKLVAQEYLTVAGGPATNAAVTFNYFGNQAKLLSVLGKHPLTELIKSDLAQQGVATVDLIPDKSDTPPVSSIIVTAATGERSIISLNAVKSQANPEIVAPDLLTNIDLVLLDGHQLEVSLKVAAIAKTRQIPVILDGGSWKPGLEELLFWVDYAICSANFYPPPCQQREDVFDFLQDCGIKYIAITQGEQAIRYREQDRNSTIPVPAIKPVDTLGAGDIFHGAFCHYILQDNFTTALKRAAKIASRSCLSFGTRSWLQHLQH